MELFKWRLLLGDTALSLFYSILKNWSIIGNLSKSSMECSFCIWLVRNNKDWTPFACSCKLDDPSKETCNSPSFMSSLKQTTKEVPNAKSHLSCQFHLPELKCYLPSKSNALSPMLRVISLNMAVIKIQPNLLTNLTFYRPLKANSIT